MSQVKWPPHTQEMSEGAKPHVRRASDSNAQAFSELGYGHAKGPVST